MKLFIASILMIASIGNAAELNGVTMSDHMMVDGKQLVLNGLGLRTVTRFGIPVKVYVAGLYLDAKNQDSDAILKSNSTKRLVMQFVRPVDRDALIEGFSKGYEQTCWVECDKQGAQFRKFSEHVVSIRKDNRITLTFYSNKVEIDSTGPNAKKQMIEDANLSRNLLSVFIHKEKSPGKDFRAGILGLANK